MNNPNVANTYKLIQLTTLFRTWYSERFENIYWNSPYFFSLQQALESNIDALATRIMPQLSSSSIQPPSIVSSSIPQTVPYTRTRSYSSYSPAPTVPDILDSYEDEDQPETSIPTEYDFNFGVSSASDSNRISFCEMITFFEEVIGYYNDNEELRPFITQTLFSLSVSRLAYDEITSTLIEDEVFEPLTIPPFEDINTFIRNLFYIYNLYAIRNPNANPNALFAGMFRAALRNAIESD